MHNVGIRRFIIPDPDGPAAVPLIAFYPCDADMNPFQAGPFTITAAQNASVKEIETPLIAISHGNSGTPWVHRDLAIGLARRGALVILPEHIGNSRTNNSLEGSRQNLLNRPRQIKISIEEIKKSKDFGPRINKTYGIGHSIGGYTILAAAGAKPYAGPQETQSGTIEPLSVEQTGFCALSLLAPATPWFQAADSFADFTTPTLMLTGQKDTITPCFHSDIITSGLSNKNLLIHETVSDAGHFSFQSPFPQSMQKTTFPPSQDPAGFDRRAYQPQLINRISEFFGMNG